MMTFVKASSQHVDSVSTLTPAIPGTVCFWYKPLISIAADDIWTVRPTNFNMGVNSSEKIVTQLFSVTNLTSVTSMVVDTLYHIVATWVASGGSTVREMFINGVSDVTATNATSTPIADIFSICPSSNPGNFSIGDFRFYNRVLSLAEIQTIYACRGLDGIVYGLLHRWKFNEGAAGVAASGTGIIKCDMGMLDMTPVNSPTWEESPLTFRRPTYRG